MGDLFTSHNIINYFFFIIYGLLKNREHGQRSWLRYYATSRKVVGSIPDEVTGFFNLPNPSSHPMALGLTQPLTKMSTKYLRGG
jgi:hypothetical protein